MTVGLLFFFIFFFFQAEDGIRDDLVTGVQTCALPIYCSWPRKAKAVSSLTSEPTTNSPLLLYAASCNLRRQPRAPRVPPFIQAASRPRSEERRVGKERTSRRAVDEERKIDCVT